MKVVTLSETMPDLAAKEIKIGGITITETMISFSIVVLAIILAAVIIRVFCIPRWRKSQKVGAVQMFLEWLIGSIDDNAKELTGHDASFVSPVYLTFASVICLGTLVEMLGLRPPISDFNVTLTLGFLSFAVIQGLGIKRKKFKRLLHYVNPINIVTDGVVPFSLALRMFGSVFSGYLIMHLIYSLPFPVGYPLIGNLIFTVFHAIMQSYVFMMLSMCFVSEAIE
ncbi:MAG TPA: FoF1 ATP synthase subunit a [Clostridia bacterium]